MKIIQMITAPSGIEVVYDGSDEEGGMWTTKERVLAFCLMDNGEVYPLVIEDGKLEVAIGDFYNDIFITEEREQMRRENNVCEEPRDIE